MTDETEYTKSMPAEHIKKFGQFFTSARVADFMCSWACAGAGTVLDPAVGNSVFLTRAKKYSPDSALTGYELDPEILRYFGNPAGADIIPRDFLLNGWDAKYDAIVCNPPYSRFQAVSNRDAIIDAIQDHTGVRYSAFTNLYVLFLLKGIFQMSEHGRLAYIIPTEFLNSGYGVPVKKLLLEQRLLRAIINFENNQDMFCNAITTCCILLLDKQPKTQVEFYNLPSVRALEGLSIGSAPAFAACISCDALDAEQKWRPILHQEQAGTFHNVTKISTFCTVSRGIATGANGFFCLSASDVRENRIPTRCLSRCVCRSADVTKAVFTAADFEQLVQAGKKVFLLDVNVQDASLIAEYLEKGVQKGIPQRYLPSRRSPWFTMEQKKTAPIWVSSACRDGIKFVRNLAGIKTLTTFHSVYMNAGYETDADFLFCYFITPIAQALIRENRKELGNGLDKFQPNDFNNARMLDIRLVREEDAARIQEIYRAIKQEPAPSQIQALNDIFSSYLL